jgi:tetratricopeptide (TPR) repeat protein
MLDRNVMLNLPEIIDFITTNKEVLGLIGVGVGTFWKQISGAITWGRNVLKKHRSGNVPDGKFPFEVIKPHSNDVMKRLMPKSSMPDSPLADANIPYQIRRNGLSVRRELEKILDEQRWALILGRSGLGKTREAAELAQQLNREGWTILNLSGQEWLDVPAQFPLEEIGTQRKLLFFLDGLNQMIVRGHSQIAPKALENELHALRVPFQERLLRVLEFYQEQCHSEEILVIATARDEREAQSIDRRSEWEKLEFKKHRKLWHHFGQYVLPEPQNGAIVDLLDAVIPKTKIQADVRDFPLIAQRNDRTFANIVENLIMLQERKLPLSSEAFPETLDRTWRMRYKAAIKRHSLAIHVYDAIALLRSLDVELQPFVVLPVAEMLAAEMLGRRRLWQMPWAKVRLRQALQFLIKTEGILEPRDGQIEAREHQIDVDRWISKLQQLLLKLSKDKPLEMQKGLMDFAFTMTDLGQTDAAHLCFERVLVVQPESERAWFGQGNVLFDQQQWEQAIACYDKALGLKAGNDQVWFNRGLALSQMKRWDAALDSYVQALAIKPDKVEALDSQGITLKALGRYPEALASYNKAVAIDPDYGQGWYNRGLTLAAMGDLMGMVESCQRALQADRTNASAWYNSACAYALMGREEKAIGSLKAAIELNPDKYKVLAKAETDFEQLQAHPEFQILLAKEV